MKRFLAIIALLATQAGAAEFSGTAAYESVEAFRSAAAAFQPAAAESDLAALFSIPTPGQPEDPETGKRAFPKGIDAAKVVWAGPSRAVVFVSARPPTATLPTVIGVLFVLQAKDGGRWEIADRLRFAAGGKYADVSVELTAQAGTGYALGEEGTAPVVWVKSIDGGRGYSYTASASYRLKESKLERIDLERKP